MASNGKVHQAEAERQQWSEGEAAAGRAIKVATLF